MKNKKKELSALKKPLAVMAHDIKAPLSGLINLLDVIEKGYVSDMEKIKAIVNRARKKAVDLMQIVDDILDYTLLDHKHSIKLEKTDIIDVIKDSFSTLKPFADTRNITMRLEKNNLSKCYVNGNKTFLMRALNNLIMNGIKYNRDSGSLVIRYEKLEKKSRIRISVSDTGIGMDEEDIRKVFQIFERGKHARKNIDGSVGLGLSLVKQIVKSHGGGITVKSKLNVGTKVSIELPLYGGTHEENNTRRR
ncbi:MAG: HAMP domain-containing histidine kinase [Spirochaetales bacterium]|nr:HAMP domain-containing histidine kinase [Spirochaetales bacterium]